MHFNIKTTFEGEMFLQIRALAASFDNSESDSSCLKPMKRKPIPESGPPTTNE